MPSNDTIKSIETDIAYVQSEIDRRRSHIDEELELMPDPVGRSHNLQRIDELRDQCIQLKIRLRRAKDLISI